jgi:hypothetical protein
MLWEWVLARLPVVAGSGRIQLGIQLSIQLSIQY